VIIKVQCKLVSVKNVYRKLTYRTSLLNDVIIQFEFLFTIFQIQIY